MGMGGISKSQVSRLCAEIDEQVNTFLERPIEGDCPYLWIDATYQKVRQAGRIVSVAAINAVAVNTQGMRDVDLSRLRFGCANQISIYLTGAGETHNEPYSFAGPRSTNVVCRKCCIASGSA